MGESAEVTTDFMKDHHPDAGLENMDAGLDTSLDCGPSRPQPG
ncbi:hypothetical protein WMF38_06320 [Sorangium sp. So ce118]